MKKLMFLVLSIFNSVIVYSQNQPFPPEMRLIVVNATSCQNYHTFSFSQLSKSYCYNSEFSDILECSNFIDAGFYGCDGGSYDLYIDEECENQFGNVGGGFCSQEGAFTSAVYGYGVYKFIDETTGHYVYFDFRDARYTREDLNYPSGCTY